MKFAVLIAAAITIAAPAMAQGTFVPSGQGGYTYLHQDNSGEISDIARQQLQRFQQNQTPIHPQVVCTTYGNQTICQ